MYTKSPMHRILHIDMDAFFAAVEELRRPSLSGKPLVIGGGGDPGSRGVVSTANYEARTFGIHSAMPLRTAHRLCPHAVFLPVDYHEYKRVSNIVKDILRGFSPVMEDVGIDEAFLDISENPESSEEVARAVKDAVRRQTSLTCSVGVGPNKLVAKIASDLQKPDGLTVVAEEDVRRLLDPLPVRKLWGIGPKTEAALGKMGIRTVAQLRARSLEELVERFGSSSGQYLYRASRGVDNRPLVTHWERKSVSREETFERDLEDWQDLARHLAALSRHVAEDLAALGVRGRTVTVKVRFSDFETRTRARTLPGAVDSEEKIRRAAFECLSRVEVGGRRVRLLGVRMGKLAKGGTS